MDDIRSVEGLQSAADEAAPEGSVSVRAVPDTAPPPDVLEMLLQDKRSENTRRAYRHDLSQFFRFLYEADPTPVLVQTFLTLATPQMTVCVLRYKAALITQGGAEATINRRLAAIRSLVKLARRIGATQADLRDQVEGEKVFTYRDTRGITKEQARKLLQQPDRSTIKGRRDSALLLLLLENALRRAEITALRVCDFDCNARTLQILGKGRGQQKEKVTLSPLVCSALQAYLTDFEVQRSAQSSLFVNVSPACYGEPLTANGLYTIVRDLAVQAKLDSVLSPHRLRHTAITAALDSSGGDVRAVQKLSRHARLETLMIYDDNRSDMQGEMSCLLSGVFSPQDVSDPH